MISIKWKSKMKIGSISALKILTHPLTNPLIPEEFSISLSEECLWLHLWYYLWYLWYRGVHIWTKQVIVTYNEEFSRQSMTFLPYITVYSSTKFIYTVWKSVLQFAICTFEFWQLQMSFRIFFLKIENP